MVNPTTTEATPMINMTMMMTASMSQGGAAIAGALRRMRFPGPSTYWSVPGDQLSFRTWWTTLDNPRYASPTDPITDEDENQLVYSLLGLEGTSRFASNPMASRMGQASFAEFVEAVKTFFQPPVNPLRTHFDFFAQTPARGQSNLSWPSAAMTLCISFWPSQSLIQTSSSRSWKLKKGPMLMLLCSTMPCNPNLHQLVLPQTAHHQLHRHHSDRLLF